MAKEDFMKADAALTADINKAQTYEDLRALLENATSRSGIADRDPQTGQFVRRDPLTPANQTAEPEDAQVTKTETIGGREFTFTGTDAKVTQQITQAYKIAEAVKPISQPVSQPARLKTMAERGQELLDRKELDMQFRTGLMTADEYLARTGAVEDYLAAQGFDVQAAAAKQFEQSWAQATETFLRDTPEGQSWKGGQKNLEIAGNLIQSHGLSDAQDKVAALRQIAREMAEKGLMFDGDVSPEQIIESTQDASPQEILEAWKSKQGTPEEANQKFIEIHRRSGSLFGKG
jgi:hypothetical protein